MNIYNQREILSCVFVVMYAALCILYVDIPLMRLCGTWSLRDVRLLRVLRFPA